MSIITDFLNAFRKKEANFVVSDFNSFQDYTALVDSQNYLDQFESWTYKALKVKAESLINYDQKLYKNGEEVENDALLRDLKRFNAFSTLDEARKVTTYHLGLTGMAFWAMTESDEVGHRVDFFILNPLRVSAKTDENGLPVAYVYRDADGKEEIIDIDNIIVFKDPSPKNWLKGYSPLQASRYAHNTNEFAHKYNMNFFGNSGRPEGFLLMEGASETERLKLEKALREKFGGVENARKLGVINRKFEYLEISKTQKELDFANSINAMRDEILSIHGVPKALAGLDDSTFANAEQALRIFQQYTLEPLLKLECGIFNNQLVKNYYKSTKTGLYFEYEDPVESDNSKEVEKATKLFDFQIITRNEAREMVGLDDIDNGDEFKQSQMPTQAIEQIEDIKKEVKAQTNLIKSIPDLDKVVETKREEMKGMMLQKNIEREQTFIDLTKEYFSNQSNRVLDSLKVKKAINLKIGIELEEEIKIAIQFFKDQYEKDALFFNKLANELAGGESTLSPEIMKKIRDNVLYFSTEINKTTQNDLQRIIATAVTEDWDLFKTRDAIKELFDKYSAQPDKTTQSRAEKIAMTEVNWIKNAVFRDNFARNEYVTGYEWLAVKDNYTRDSHAEADGLFRPKGFKFPVWSDELSRYEYMEFPGDRNATAGNVINCRCSLIPVVNED